MSKLTRLKPIIRLSVGNPETDSNSVFGRGIASLCLGVRETGSLNAAAKGMGMAYSKAWRIIKDTVKALFLRKSRPRCRLLQCRGLRYGNAFIMRRPPCQIQGCITCHFQRFRRRRTFARIQKHPWYVRCLSRTISIFVPHAW